MTIDALPTAPSIDDPANFATEADAFVAALATFVTQANALATEVNTYAASAFSAVSGINSAAAGGTVDAITATFDPAVTLTDGALCAIVSAGANTSTTPTFAPNGLTAHTITLVGGGALVAGNIGGQGTIAVLKYVLASTRWELLNPERSGSTILLQHATANNSAYVALEDLLDGTYDAYFVLGVGVRVQNDAAGLQCELKIGGAYPGANYAYHTSNPISNAATYAAQNSTSAAAFLLIPNIGNAAGKNARIELTIDLPTSTSLMKLCSWEGVSIDNAGYSQSVKGGGHNTGTAAVTGAKFTASSGNLVAGEFYLYGYAKS